MKKWTRKDGVTVILVQRSDRTSTVYVDRGHTIIKKDYETWEQWEARDVALELAELLGCEEVPHAA